MLTNKERLIKAFYTYSEELGKEVEALIDQGSDPERLKKLRQLVSREFGKQAGLAYGTIVAVLSPTP